MSVLILFLFKQHLDPFEVEDGFALIFVRHLLQKPEVQASRQFATRLATRQHGMARGLS